MINLDEILTAELQQTGFARLASRTAYQDVEAAVDVFAGSSLFPWIPGLPTGPSTARACPETEVEVTFTVDAEGSGGFFRGTVIDSEIRDPEGRWWQDVMDWHMVRMSAEVVDPDMPDLYRITALVHFTVTSRFRALYEVMNELGWCYDGLRAVYTGESAEWPEDTVAEACRHILHRLLEIVTGPGMEDSDLTEGVGLLADWLAVNRRDLGRLGLERLVHYTRGPRQELPPETEIAA